jgi:hypothetical protein
VDVDELTVNDVLSQPPHDVFSVHSPVGVQHRVGCCSWARCRGPLESHDGMPRRRVGESVERNAMGAANENLFLIEV